MSRTTESLDQEVNRVFTEIFGHTPLGIRMDDILKQAIALTRFTTVNQMTGKLGDLMASCIQLANESGRSSEVLVEDALDKIISRRSQYAGAGRKIRVGIVGGALDPITNGHIAMGQFVLNSTSLFDEVWFTPCNQHMLGKKMADPHHRIMMTNLAITYSGDRRLKVFDYEVANKLSGTTIHFMTKLKEDPKYSYCDFSYIIGMDNANSIETWVEYQHLLRLVPFVVVSRKGVARKRENEWYMKPPHSLVLDESRAIPETSSTEVRSLMSKETNPASTEGELEYVAERIGELICEPVFNYIKANKLYFFKEEEKKQNGI